MATIELDRQQLLRLAEAESEAVKNAVRRLHSPRSYYMTESEALSKAQESIVKLQDVLKTIGSDQTPNDVSAYYNPKTGALP